MEREEWCYECYYWGMDEEEVKIGIPQETCPCKRHAPRAIDPNVIGDDAKWPMTNFDNWCGDFKKRL